MREFVKEMKDDVQHVPSRFAAASTLSSLMAPITLVVGLATLVGYGPIEETLVLMGAPSWAVPLLGVVEVAAAVALVVPFASFFAALVLAALSLVGAFLYARLGEASFATVLGVLGVCFIGDAAVRGPELSQRGRGLWRPAQA